MIITILGSDSVSTIYEQGHGIINYVVNNWDNYAFSARSQYSNYTTTSIDFLVKLLQKEIPEATIQYYKLPEILIIIDIPDGIYLLTQLKYSEYINAIY